MFDKTQITTLISQNQLGAARQLLSKSPLPEANTDLAEYHHVSGLIELFDNQYDSAIDCIKQALALRKDHRFYNNLGEAQRRAKLYEDAQVSFNKALELKPDYQDARYNLGINAFDQGKISEAQVSLKKALKQQPDNILVKNALADCLRTQGRFKQAIAAYQEIIKEDTNKQKAHINIAALYLHKGDLDLALEHCQQALSNNPGELQALINLARYHIEQDDLESAMDSYAKAHEYHPDSLELNCAIAKVWLEVGDIGETHFWYQKALTIDPEHLDAKVGLASALREQGELDTALLTINEILEKNESHFEALLEKSQILWDDGNASDAVKCLEQAIELKPEIPALHAKLASILSSSGETEKSLAANNKALEINPLCVPALTNIATTLKGQTDPRIISTIEKLVEQSTGKDGSLASLSSALAHYHDGMKNYQQAACYANQANQYQWAHKSKRGWEYTTEEYKQYIDKVCSVFHGDFFAKRQGWGLDSTLPVFIVGMPRSGTTLTEQVLANHKNILGIGEKNFASKSLDSIRILQQQNQNPLELLESLTQEDVRNIAQQYLDELHKLIEKSGKQNVLFVVDKMPDNYSQIGWIHLLFPKAKIIYAQRDLRDVAVSCWITQFSKIRWACDAHFIAERIREHIRVMEFWDSTLPELIYKTHYEALVANQEEITTQLLQVLGLPFDENCLKFYKSDRLVRTASVSQVRKPIYKNSVHRWKRYEKDMQPVCNVLDELNYYGK